MRSSLTGCLAALVAILIADAAIYQSRITQRGVTASLEVLRGEIPALQRAEAPAFQTAPDPLPVPSAPDPAPAPAPAEPVREATRAEGLTEGDAYPARRREEAQRRRTRPRSEEARPRLSRADLERVQEWRQKRDAKRRQRRLDMLESPEAETRARAVFGLDPSDRRDADALADAIDDPDPGVRVEAASRLQFGEPRVALPLLVQALADPEPVVVVEAIDSLKFLRDPGAIPDLEPLLHHPDPAVQREARAAVDRLR